MFGLIILILVLYLFFNPKVLPGMGSWLGGQSRKPVRQAKWMWTSFTGTEDESIKAEREYGQECARVFATQFPGKVSQTDRDLVAEIGARLGEAVKDPRRKFRFTVADSTLANAFALPGGYIFITKSLLDLCKRDRDEIAFFLGHEIGHILQGHARDRMTAETLLNAIGSRLPAAGQMLRHLASTGYSRMQEAEADREGLRLAARAGFDARASVDALERLGQVAPSSSGLMEYLSSHPPISERVQELKKCVAAEKGV